MPLQAFITILMFAMFVVCFTGNDKNRDLTLKVFAVVTLGHDLLSYDLKGGAYLLSAALADLLIITILGFITRPTNTTKNLMCVSLAFIVVNFIGYILLINKVTLTPYVIMSIALYTIALIFMIKPDKGVYNSKGRTGGDNRNNSLFSSIYGYIFTRLLHRNQEGV